jgi:REP element-mobilizing transposase RayT
MDRGIEGTQVFRKQGDREDFLERMGALCDAGAWVVYAWALMPNHFHLLVRSAKESLPFSMRRLLTGYVVNFNRRHKRQGHLFQNRYKSIICEDDPYLLELTRYIHLNPLRARIVESLEGLSSYPWTGHSAIMGRVKRPWQDTEAVLSYFGRKKGEATRKYEKFLREGAAQGKRPELVGGGLIRSAGGWSEVLSMRRRGQRMASDERVLGSGGFIEGLLEEAEQRHTQTLRLRRKTLDLESLGKRVAKGEGVDLSVIRSGSRTRRAVYARRLLCQLAVTRIGYSGAEVARYLGATTSSVTRLANSEEIPGLGRYLQCNVEPTSRKRMGRYLQCNVEPTSRKRKS